MERNLYLIGGIGLGAGLLAYGLTMKAPWACVVGTLGLGLVAASVANVPVGEWIGWEGQSWPEGRRSRSFARESVGREASRPTFAGASS